MPNFSLSDAVFENAAAKYPTPFHLYDEAGIRRNARTLKQAEEVIRLLPKRH